MNNILIYDLLYRVALDIDGPLLETKNGNMYVLVAIDHYLKWCEARLVKDHDVAIATRFLEEEIICKLCPYSFSLIIEVNGWSNLT
jgi:transposase-like protein